MRTSLISYFLFFSLSLTAGVSSAEIFDGTSSSQSSNTPVADPVVNHAQPVNPGLP